MREPSPLGNPLGKRGSACVEVMTTLHESTPSSWRRVEGCVLSNGTIASAKDPLTHPFYLIEPPQTCSYRRPVNRDHGFDSGGFSRPRLEDRWVVDLAGPASRQRTTDATSLLVVAPIPASEDAHARMDRLEQRMRQMRVSDGAISWDDFDGAPMASLLAQFRMSEIERSLSGAAQCWFASLDASRRRTWDDLAQDFLRQFAFNIVIDV
ncbi:hypothetical protein CK203_106389 [Vitis vinifera]|uniref:Retrotransposon gag domain-containing protein n=1 Tax=Vitis vinifera TaxID=29760 RepID=A0A438CZ02_VITVI|nr:hypothetical protein CK203_106389 [Vitis vinifera]